MASDLGSGTNGLLLGRYRVDADLGEGSFGTVVRAFDTRLKRTVAIKTLKRVESADIRKFRAIEERFAREAEAGSRMGIHPNLVTVHDLVIEPDHTQYLILEYVRGGTVAEHLASGPLRRGDALRIAADVARGLQAAHEVGIVHRDVKPANIFLAPDGRAQLGDFGVAQIDDVSARTHTAAQHPGTPLYMSPEQEQTTGYVRPASDQYSLGLVLFEMLTGTAYKRIGARATREQLAILPPAVAALIEEMIAPDPDDRLPSCDRVARRIAEVIHELGMTETEIQFDAPHAGRGYVTDRPPGVASDRGSGSGAIVRPPAWEEQGSASPATGSVQPSSRSGSGVPPGTAPPPPPPPVTTPKTVHVALMPVPPVQELALPAPAAIARPPHARRSRRGLFIAVFALLFIALGTGGAFFLRGADGTPDVTQTPQQPAATVIAAATIAATPTGAPTATLAPTVEPTPTVRPTIVPSATAAPPTATPSPRPATASPTPAKPSIAVFSVGTTNANLETVNGDDVVTTFTTGQEVYGFVNFGGAQVNKDVLEITLVANGTPQQPQSYTAQKSDGFHVFPLGRLNAGQYRLEVRYAGKIAQAADFRVFPPPTPRPLPTAAPPTATTAAPTSTTARPTGTAAATTATRPTATPYTPPTATPKPLP